MTMALRPGSMSRLALASRASVLVTSIGLAALQVAAQTPQFEAAAHAMSIHVSVVGPEGRFVSGLGITDFELLVDGRVQHLTGVFEAGGDVSAPGRPPALRTETRETDPTAMRVVDNDLPTGARRHFLLVFDLTQAGPRTLGYARSAALEFLAGDVRESDMVGVAVYGPHRGLDFAVPFTSQHTAAAKWLEGFGNRSAMERLAPVGDGIDLQAIAELDAQSAEFVEEIEEIRVAMGAENMVEALTQLADALAVVEGRKHVLFFSRGLPDTLMMDAGFRQTAQAAIARSRSAAAVIHSFHPDVLPVSDVHDLRRMGSGLRTEGGVSGVRDPLSAVVSRSIFNNRQILNMLAEETGGTSTFYRHNLGDGLANVERITRSYYVLTFSLRLDDADHVDVDLRVRQPGVEVLWTPSRLLITNPTSLTPDQHMLKVAAALDLAGARSEIALEVLGLPLSVRDGTGRLAMAIEIPFRALDELLARREGETLDFEILGAVA